RVVGHRGTKTQHKQGNANHENVTAIITICGNGSRLKPTIIFKGKHFQSKWQNNNLICISENGWTDGESALQWMKKDFNLQTQEKANGETCILFMDGHNSHYSADLLEYCKGNNIEILGYPPHCTHALQGLDVVCFAKQKGCWKDEVNKREETTGRGVNKEDFAKVFGTAFIQAMTEDIILAAWKATGLIQFNPNIIKPEQMRSSEITSTKSTFPLPQNSPTRAIMTAFREYKFTNLDNSSRPSTPVPGPSQFPDSPSMLNQNLFATPFQDRMNIDPSLYPSLLTPSKHMRFLRNGLSSTASGSFLVKKTKATHEQMSRLIQNPTLETVPANIPRPDWSLL
ncbi:DDE-domain-containing protein, partial [Dendrothele bispora CBS 962.96]